MNLAWLPPEKPKSVEARFHFDACVSPFAQAVGQMFAVFIAEATDGKHESATCHQSTGILFMVYNGNILGSN